MPFAFLLMFTCQGHFHSLACVMITTDGDYVIQKGFWEAAAGDNYFVLKNNHQDLQPSIFCQASLILEKGKVVWKFTAIYSRAFIFILKLLNLDKMGLNLILCSNPYLFLTVKSCWKLDYKNAFSKPLAFSSSFILTHVLNNELIIWAFSLPFLFSPHSLLVDAPKDPVYCKLCCCKLFKYLIACCNVIQMKIILPC